MRAFAGSPAEFDRADKEIDAMVEGFTTYDRKLTRTLCHYTNAQGFRGILQNRHFRATSAAHMGEKDTKEMKHANEFIEAALEELAQKDRKVIEEVRFRREHRSIVTHDRIGIACFTT